VNQKINKLDYSVRGTWAPVCFSPDGQAGSLMGA